MTIVYFVRHAEPNYNNHDDMSRELSDKGLILEYLRQYTSASKKDIRNLLWDKLPNALSDNQKENKMRNLLTSMKKAELNDKDSDNQQKSRWVLK